MVILIESSRCWEWVYFRLGFQHCLLLVDDVIEKLWKQKLGKEFPKKKQINNNDNKISGIFKNKLQWENLPFGTRKKDNPLRNYFLCVKQQIISEFQPTLNSVFVVNKCKTNWGSHRLLCLFISWNVKILWDYGKLRSFITIVLEPMTYKLW